MSRRFARSGLLALAAALLLAGCGGGGGGARLTAPTAGRQDINPRDPATLRDGGDLRIPLGYLPVNYNYPSGLPASDAIARVALNQLAQIGVRVVIDAEPVSQFFSGFVNTGNFDLATYSYVGSSAAFSNSLNVYQEPKGTDLGINFGRIYDSRIGALFAQGLAELDDAKRAEIGNQVDRIIWEEVHDIPLFPRTGA